MVDIVKPDISSVWAEAGAIIAPSNEKIKLGWTSEVPPHQYENFVQNRQDEMLAYLNQKGVPEWRTGTEYFLGKSFVQDAGKIYKANKNSGGLLPNQKPSTDATNEYWEQATFSLSDLKQAVGTSTKDVMSQKATSDAIALKIDSDRVIQATGTSITHIMSQKAVTDALEFRSLSLRENIKVTVGAGGDFPTINAAVLHLSRFTPDLGVTAEVELMSGFVMSEQLIVEGLDLGWITITGVDAETVINEPSLTRVLVGDNKPAFGVMRGTLPTIGQLFSFSSKGSTGDRRSGVMAYRIGRSSILDSCGVKNAGTNSIYAVMASTINAKSANASGAGGTAIYADSSSTINANGANASGAGVNGIYAQYGSTINANGVDASGAGTAYSINVSSGSIINANGATGTPSQAKNTVTANGIIFQQ